MIKELGKYRIILASASPRRQHLLKDMGIEFEIISQDVSEQFPAHLKKEEVALYLCEYKADSFPEIIDDKTIVITADTIVCLDDRIISKPCDKEEALAMLKELSGRTHEVYTGICFRSSKKKYSFYDVSYVTFRKLLTDEINFYVDKYLPLDKAGAYGAQEWIGYIGIKSIEGSYFNVMGLPTHKVYEELQHFIKDISN